MPMIAIVVAPLVASIRAPPTSMPTGCRPSENVRAVLPMRPSSSSGEYAVRSVRYMTSTIDWATPATNATASRTGTSTVTASTISATAHRQVAADEHLGARGPGRSAER